MNQNEINEQALALARIEVKLDTLIATNGDHELRLRAIEARKPVETYGFVTGRQLWAGLVGCGSVMSAVVAAIALIVR